MPIIGQRKGWTQGNVFMVMEDNKRQRGLASIHGQVFVSSMDVGKDEPRRWRVSSLTTGYQLTNVSNEQDARRIAEYLVRRWSGILSLKDPDAIRSKLPEWVGSWLVEQRKRGAWVDPEEFRQEQADNANS